MVRQWFVELGAGGAGRGGVEGSCAGTAIQQQYLTSKCRDVFNEAAQAVTGAADHGEFCLRGQRGRGLWARLGDTYEEIILSPDYVFDNFVDGAV